MVSYVCAVSVFLARNSVCLLYTGSGPLGPPAMQPSLGPDSVHVNAGAGENTHHVTGSGIQQV